MADLTRREFIKGTASMALASSLPLGGCSGESSLAPYQSLHIVGSKGAFGWFQLIWPHVEVVQADNFAAAGDLAKLAFWESSASARIISPSRESGDNEWAVCSSGPWINSTGPIAGMDITAIVSGTNAAPTTVLNPAPQISGTADLLAGVAAIQVQESSSVLPVVGVEPINFGSAPGSPAINSTSSAEDLSNLYTTQGFDFSPTSNDLVTFGIDGINAVPDNDLSATQRAGLEEFGNRMIVVSKALAAGASECCVVGVSSGDITDTLWTNPTQAFASDQNLNRTINVVGKISAILNGVYSTLQSASRADNVVITVHGDAPHSPLDAAGWPLQTPGNSNWIYVVGKGQLHSGWFGRVHVNGNCGPGIQNNCVSGFNGTTGALVLGQASTATTEVAAAAIAYAVSRGNTGFIEGALGGQPLANYAGLVK